MHHFQILFSEVLIYIFAFGISDTILSILPNTSAKIIFILIIGIFGLTMNYYYAYK
jgi:hypothetical protein